MTGASGVEDEANTQNYSWWRKKKKVKRSLW